MKKHTCLSITLVNKELYLICLPEMCSGGGWGVGWGGGWFLSYFCGFVLVAVFLSLFFRLSLASYLAGRTPRTLLLFFLERCQHALPTSN